MSDGRELLARHAVDDDDDDHWRQQGAIAEHDDNATTDG